MHMRDVWMFPGHGCQYVGMGGQVLASSSKAKVLVELAEDCLRLPLRTLLEKGKSFELQQPQVLEPLLLIVQCTYVDLLKDRYGSAGKIAGYSAGILAACYAAGVASAETMLTIAVCRGRILKQAASSHTGGMLAVYGIETRRILDVISEASDLSDQLTIAAYNAVRHTTLTGDVKDLKFISRQLRAQGAETAFIEAAGAWHSHLAQQAAAETRCVMDSFSLKKPEGWLLCGDRTRPLRTVDDVRDAIAFSISRPIQWASLISNMIDQGSQVFIDIGPGRTLYSFFTQMELPDDVTCHYLERNRGRYSIPHCYQKTSVASA
ncbi:MAG: ACP S-malonyltransferase [Pseudomonadota bacterium]|nr:ACP S-malonyltransferase [Pseudomonadota bacterium]